MNGIGIAANTANHQQACLNDFCQISVQHVSKMLRCYEPNPSKIVVVIHFFSVWNCRRFATRARARRSALLCVPPLSSLISPVGSPLSSKHSFMMLYKSRFDPSNYFGLAQASRSGGAACWWNQSHIRVLLYCCMRF